ncbi:cellulose biosynthesis cyclic di-GMP-binding regulatory protein BcsB [Acidithiobacillus sp. AMEEHan]|uniref:cellulose biosynthesis cyclic di-GMP-binding regulatory protein BcsB n=1 Tax=Acidithiobacillus sp. AMEEHan TaxID=2994951 RepID=UPI0027E4712C|nr:cellulose biosynthesis cyclic di-GMP-binding regulatory protein BcsB [Acidithiobacillus sp. AMEEHan]
MKWSALAFLMVFLWPSWTWADSGLIATASDGSVSESDNVNQPTYEKMVKLAFATTIGSKAPIILQGHGATVRIPFSIPFGEKVNSINVHIYGHVSRSLANSALLEAESDGETIAQLDVQSGKDVDKKFAIPTQHLDPGFHSLILKLVGVTGDSELNWVQLDPRASDFAYLTTPKPIPALLDHMDWFFDRAALNYAPKVAVYSPPNKDNLQAISYVAQGIGLRYQFLPVKIQWHMLQVNRTDYGFDSIVHKLPENSRIAIIVGTTDEIGEILKQVGISEVTKTSIFIRQFPNHINHYLLILTGRDQDQVLQAAETFADQHLHFPPVSSLSLQKEIGSDSKSETLPVNVTPFARSTFPLSAAGFKTATLNGFSGPISVRIWNGGWQRDGELRLNLIYSAGMSGTADLNVLFNGALEGSIPLNSPTGGKYLKYAVSIPSTVAKSGWNTLTLVPNLIPASSHDFLYNVERDNLQLSVFSDSTFTWQGGSVLRHLDLTALSSAGMLGLRPGQQVNLVLPEHSGSDTLSAMVTLLGKIAQIYGQVFPVHVSFGNDLHDGPILAIAPLSQLPSTLRRSVGIKSSNTGGGTWELTRMLRNIEPGSGHSLTVYDFHLQKQTLALSSSYHEHPLIVFSAVEPGTLEGGVDSLIGFDLWPQLRGFTDWWQTGGKSVHAVAMEDIPFFAFGASGGIGVWVSRHVWLAIALFFALALAMSVLIYTRVRSRYRRLPAESQVLDGVQGRTK